MWASGPLDGDDIQVADGEQGVGREICGQAGVGGGHGHATDGSPVPVNNNLATCTHTRTQNRVS